MAQLQPLRGTRDLLGDDCRKFRHLVSIAQKVSELYGFEEIETPVLEAKAVFSRTLGDESDVVTKQMYVFQDRGGDELILRPEGTAGVARAFISEGMSQNVPVKLFYAGPMFRYERPQKGRYRQFYQFGVELLGVEKPQADIEVIAMAWQTLKALKLDSLVKLQLNTLGDAESRAAYRDALVAYLRTRQSELSEESRTRLEKNPLRILDSKDEKDRAVIQDAPLFTQHLNDASKSYFEAVCAGLAELSIPFTADPYLVRGFDYYCHTVFEFTTTALGAQNAVLGGGRYDGLIQAMGGPATPGVGWAAGTDRLALILADVPAKARPVALVPMSEASQARAMLLAQQLREAGLAVDLAYSGNLGKRLKRANKVQARWAVILGEEELSRGTAVLKDLDQGTQSEVPLSELPTRLSQHA